MCRPASSPGLKAVLAHGSVLPTAQTPQMERAGVRTPTTTVILSSPWYACIANNQKGGTCANGIRKSLKAMGGHTYSSDPSGWKEDTQKHCGLEAKVTDPTTGKTMLMYIGDAFDDNWIPKGVSAIIIAPAPSTISLTMTSTQNRSTSCFLPSPPYMATQTGTRTL